MLRLQKTVHFSVVLSQLGHVFCCGLPAVVAALSIFSGIGLLGALPHSLEAMHELMHRWEFAILVFSGSMLVLGFVLDRHAARVDCHDTGCGHPPCDTKKRRVHIVLKFAALLFLVNIISYIAH